MITYNLNTWGEEISSLGHVIEQGIDNHETLEFEYDGTKRTVEPHCLGVTTAGNPCLRGYEQEPADSFRLYKLEKINLCFPVGRFGKPRDGYVRGDSAMIYTFSEL